ncbi:MAG: CRISPR-associated endoribonuclease Cas6 [Candidatus Njordarchaeales archaeon]
MPLRIDFFLTAETDSALPPFTGEYVREWFIQLIKHADLRLFTNLFFISNPRPYAIRPLRPLREKMRIINGHWIIWEGDKLSFSISVLRDDVNDNIIEIMRNVQLINFDTLDCRVDNIKIISIKYERIPSEISRRIYLIFRTPTLFNIRGRVFPFLYPDPIRVISNLSRIWNSFVPPYLRINREYIINWASRSISVKSYKLMTREVKIKGVKLTGFKGRVEWLVLNEEMMNDLARLIYFAEFSNVGEKRTYGLGVLSVVHWSNFNRLISLFEI